MARKIEDFGEKIGGARKDIWKLRGLMLRDLLDMNEAEQKKYVKKDNVWPKPNWEERIANGEDKMLCFWKNEVRKALPASPDAAYGNNKVERYVAFVGEMRDAVMGVTSLNQAMSVYNGVVLNCGYVVPKYGRMVATTEKGSGLITNKLLKACTSYSPRHLKMQKSYTTFGVPKADVEYVLFKNNMSKHQYDKVQAKFVFLRDRNCLMIQDAYHTSFYYPKECEEYSCTWKEGTWFLIDESIRKILAYNLDTEKDADELIEKMARDAAAVTTPSCKSKKAGKKSFVFPQLTNTHRVGPDQGIKDVAPEQLTDMFGFRGGEFGEWLASDEERQEHLNLAYDAFLDLAEILGVSAKSMTFDGKLSIAFGSRGKGGASAGAAHYEPLRQVINLTRMHGAGCLAHEWGHAFDHYLAGTHTQQFPAPIMESDNYGRRTADIRKEFSDVMDCIFWKSAGEKTQYYVDSQMFDSVYKKFGHGYWASKCEMFARAFDCYVSDKLKQAGRRNDYLTSHADGFILTLEGSTYRAYPTGEERQKINEAFDKLFASLIATQML